MAVGQTVITMQFREILAAFEMGHTYFTYVMGCDLRIFRSSNIASTILAAMLEHSHPYIYVFIYTYLLLHLHSTYLIPFIYLLIIY